MLESKYSASLSILTVLKVTQLVQNLNRGIFCALNPLLSLNRRTQELEDLHICLPLNVWLLQNEGERLLVRVVPPLYVCTTETADTKGEQKSLNQRWCKSTDVWLLASGVIGLSLK